MKGYKIDDFEMMVISFDGMEFDFEIIEMLLKIYIICFVFKESGEYIIYVWFKSGRKKDIFGSFFKVFVEVFVWGGVVKCVVVGFGFEWGVVNYLGEFIVWICDVGLGGFVIVVEGFVKLEIKCIDNGDGFCNIFYLLIILGEYIIYIWFVDEDIFGSLFKINVLLEVEDCFRDFNVIDFVEGGLKVN